MSSIVAQGLGKAFRVYPRRHHRLLEWLDPRARKRHAQKWVLQDLSFEIDQGESVALVGLNGAGKSTLLRMIAGVLQPSSGSLQVNGTLCAILELGLSFRQDLTGRENARMAGLLMGLSSAEIDGLMPQIEAFAEIGADFDRPMRTYSTGMLARVAFSVATARRCDVILVDEALSVGDAYFQQKSFARLREYRAAGSTLVLVSHDKAAVQSICDSVLLLDGGRLVARDAPAPMFDLYNALIAGESAASVERSPSIGGATRLRSGSGEARVTGVALCDAQSGAHLSVCEVGQAVVLKIDVAVEQALERLVLGFSIRDRLGNVVFGTNTHHTGQALHALEAGRRLQFALHMPLNIGAGRYSISTALVDGPTHLGANFEWVDHAHEFDVVMGAASMFEGAAWLSPRIEVRG